MIIDKNLQFSESQALTGTAISDVVEFNTQGGVHALGTGCPLTLVVSVGDESFVGGTSIQAVLVSADDEALTAGVTEHVFSPVIATANLSIGEILISQPIPNGRNFRKYVGVRYTVVGAITAGKMNAALVVNAQNAPHYNVGN